MYLYHTNFKMDFRIALCTAIRILGLRSGIGPRWTGLTRCLLTIEARKAELRRQKEAQQNKRVQALSAEIQEQAWDSISGRGERHRGRTAPELTPCGSDSFIGFSPSEFETPSGYNRTRRSK